MRSGLSKYFPTYFFSKPKFFLHCNYRVEGGKDPYSAEFYHPLVITSDPIGGYDRLSEEMVLFEIFSILTT